MITDKQWQELRDKFFKECTWKENGFPVVNTTPHNLFEWFKNEIKKLEE